VTVLAIETATVRCSAAVVSGERTLAERSLSIPRAHSEKLLTLVGEALSASGLTLDRVDAVCVSIGPGSFTGLRIGLSVAKGLAFASSRPLIAVPTLEAIAWNAGRSGGAPAYILPVIDARREDVYCALYHYDGSHVSERAGARAVGLPEIAGLIGDAAPVVVAGDGTAKFSRYLLSCPPGYRGKFLLPDLPDAGVSASAVGVLGGRALDAGRVSDLADLEPLYVKDFYTLVKTQHPSVD
jgi:tRNA threonylcarbamoyladenosine biosynthesis protein TsaB